MARKRAPGAGRKPRGPFQGKISNFSTRISADTRGALEAEAARKGQSISQVAERLLRIGLETMHGREAGDPVRALCYLIEGIARLSAFIRQDDKFCDWRNDRYTFDAFRVAVDMLLDRLTPSDKLILPEEIDGVPTRRTVERHGEIAFAAIWRGIQQSRPEAPSQIESNMREAQARPFRTVTLGDISSTAFAVENVRRALNIEDKNTLKSE